jgi:hypothetical protein
MSHTRFRSLQQSGNTLSWHVYDPPEQTGGGVIMSGVAKAGGYNARVRRPPIDMTTGLFCHFPSIASSTSSSGGPLAAATSTTNARYLSSFIHLDHAYATRGLCRTHHNNLHGTGTFCHEHRVIDPYSHVGCNIGPRIPSQRIFPQCFLQASCITYSALQPPVGRSASLESY